MAVELTKQQAILVSITHWERLIEWVKKQSKRGTVSDYRMERAIGESWFGAFCPLCTWSTKQNVERAIIDKAKGTAPDRFISDCMFCPLQKKYGPCTISNSSLLKSLYGDVANTEKEWYQNAWEKVACAGTWGTWLKNARVLLDQLKSLRQ